MEQKVMSYKQVLESVSRKTGINVTYCRAISDELFDVISKNAISGKTVQIKGFGVFRLKFLGARTIPRHYISGEKSITPAHFKLSFKEYQPLRERICERFRAELMKANEESC